MKKITILIALMMVSLGQSQNLRLGFESGESGNAFGPFGDFSNQPVQAGTGSNTSLVLPIITNPAGQIWQGTNFTLTTPVQLTTSKTMTIDVLSSTPVTFLMKVNGGVAGAAEAAAQASHNGNGTWQTISFTFNTSLDGKAAQANGVYNNMVIHPFFPFSGSASARTFYIDNISGPQATVAPTLSNFAISAKTVGSSFQLTAPTTNSAGAFTYTSNNPAVATVSGTTVSVVGVGNGSITATQAANGSYLQGTITATFLTTNLTIPTLGSLTVPNKVSGDAPFNVTAPTSNSPGAFTYTSSNTAVATISGSTVTIVGVGTSTITATQAATASYATASTTATLTVTVPAAPTPTNAAVDVISIFSNAYTDVAGTNFYPNWGQTTQYVQENGMLKYSNLNFQGITFSPPINGAAMEKLHIDIWTPNCTSFQMFVLDGSDEQSVTLTPSFNGWNSFDISLSQYTLLTKSNILEFKMVGTTGSTVYLDNIYFWKLPAGTFTYYADTDGDGYGAGAAFLSTATTAPTGYSVNNTDCNDTNAAVNPGATEVLNSIDDDCDGQVDEGLLPTTPTIAAPTPPARNASDVKSLYSGAYTNEPVDSFLTPWSASSFALIQVADNATLKYSNLDFAGIETPISAQINASDMETLHIDYWTPNMTTVKVKVVDFGANGVFGGGDDTEDTHINNTPTLAGWNSIDIPLSSLTGLTSKSHITQIILTGTPAGTSTLFVDNLYFYRAATLGTQNFETSKVSLYPNPVKNTLNIEANGSIERVTVYSILGQEVMSKSPNSNATTLQTSGLQKGTYIVKSTIDGKTSTSKFIKE